MEYSTILRCLHLPLLPRISHQGPWTRPTLFLQAMERHRLHCAFTLASLSLPLSHDFKLKWLCLGRHMHLPRLFYDQNTQVCKALPTNFQHPHSLDSLDSQHWQPPSADPLRIYGSGCESVLKGQVEQCLETKFKFSDFSQRRLHSLCPGFY